MNYSPSSKRDEESSGTATQLGKRRFLIHANSAIGLFFTVAAISLFKVTLVVVGHMPRSSIHRNGLFMKRFKDNSGPAPTCVAQGGTCGSETLPCCSTNDLPTICDRDTSECVPCGGLNQPCCPGETPCEDDQGNICDGTTNECIACGGLGQPCCTGDVDCDSRDAMCQNSECIACGGLGEPCCFNLGMAIDLCRDDSICDGNGKCIECGGLGEPCCLGDECTTDRCVDNEFCANCYSGPTDSCLFSPCCEPSKTCSMDTFQCISCGKEGEPCCDNNACDSSLACVPKTGTCEQCVAENTLCLNNPCCLGSICDFDRDQCLSCGGRGEECCLTGTACPSSDLECDTESNVHTCIDCGGNGQVCCFGSTGNLCSGSDSFCSLETNTCNQCISSGGDCSGGKTCCSDSEGCNSGGQCVSCGGPGEPCCDGDVPCQYGVSCVEDNTCQVCGETDGPCCDTYSRADECQDGSNACNIIAQKCVTCRTQGETCGTTTPCCVGFVCNSGSCVECGGNGQQCCVGNNPGDDCNSGLTCNYSTNQCTN